jgi:DNA polymerase
VCVTQEARLELAEIAASLRSYLEVVQDSGAEGVPRSEVRSRLPIDLPPPSAFPTPASVIAPSVVVPQPTAMPAAPTRTLAVLQAEVAACKKCELHKTRTNTVFFRGNPSAQICFVGEAPGEDEDKQGKPFVGRAGQLLDRMIVAMGLKPEEDVYVCNILKCRPPGNRRPTPDETETCIPYLHDQLANVKPKVMVALGNTAVAALLGTKMGITKIRGEWKLSRHDARDADLSPVVPAPSERKSNAGEARGLGRPAESLEAARSARSRPQPALTSRDENPSCPFLGCVRIDIER